LSTLGQFDAYLFDLDGTLVDSAPDIDAALNACLAAHDYPDVDEALTRHWVGHGSRVLIEQALTHHGFAERIADVAHLDAMQRVFIDHYSDHIADASLPYPGVVDALEGLTARGAKLGVVTNKFERLACQVLDALALHPYFGVVLGGDSLWANKPSAVPAVHACATLGVGLNHTLFVGDSTTDVECARAAGCAVVCVRDGYNHGTPAEALGADGVIDSMTELL
jgi:phosphoglycolate phosphatase